MGSQCAVSGLELGFLKQSQVRAYVIILLDICALSLLPFVWLLRKIIQRVRPKRRLSIWTGAPVITVAKNCRVERSLGFDARSVVRSSYYITQEFDYDLSKLCGRQWLVIIVSYYALIMICLFAEQVHAYVDGGILPPRREREFNPVELWLYRVLGVRLFAWTYGGDVRTQSVTVTLGSVNCCTNCDAIGKACICKSSKANINYSRVKRVAKAVFSMGDMIEYTPGSRNDLFYWPIDLDTDAGQRYRPVYPLFHDERPLRVVHAPNHRQFKGTRFLEAAVAALSKKSIDIELVLVENIPNTEALEIYRSADVIFDQCLIGFHGYFALEAMALGKPVMCFIRDRQRYLLAPEECPILDVQVSSLESTLEYWATIGRSQLGEVGRQSRGYIEKYYTNQAFARRLSNVYKELGVEC